MMCGSGYVCSRRRRWIGRARAWRRCGRRWATTDVRAARSATFQVAESVQRRPCTPSRDRAYPRPGSHRGAAAAHRRRLGYRDGVERVDEIGAATATVRRGQRASCTVRRFPGGFHPAAVGAGRIERRTTAGGAARFWKRSRNRGSSSRSSPGTTPRRCGQRSNRWAERRRVRHCGRWPRCRSSRERSWRRPRIRLC